VILEPGLSHAALRDLDAAFARDMRLTLTYPLYPAMPNASRLILEALRRAAPDSLPAATFMLILFPHRGGSIDTLHHAFETHLCRLRRSLAACGVPPGAVQTIKQYRDDMGRLHLTRYRLRRPVALSVAA